jgi:hypothetical protein
VLFILRGVRKFTAEALTNPAEDLYGTQTNGAFSVEIKKCYLIPCVRYLKNYSPK